MDTASQLEALTAEYQDARSRIVNPDYYDADTLARRRAMYELEQIGAHEHVAARHAARGRGSLDQLYRGPAVEGTQEEQRALRREAHLRHHIRFQHLPLHGECLSLFFALKGRAIELGLKDEDDGD